MTMYKRNIKEINLIYTVRLNQSVRLRINLNNIKRQLRLMHKRVRIYNSILSASNKQTGTTNPPVQHG